MLTLVKTILLAVGFRTNVYLRQRFKTRYSSKKIEILQPDTRYSDQFLILFVSAEYFSHVTVGSLQQLEQSVVSFWVWVIQFQSVVPGCITASLLRNHLYQVDIYRKINTIVSMRTSTQLKTRLNGLCTRSVINPVKFPFSLNTGQRDQGRVFNHLQF